MAAPTGAVSMAKGADLTPPASAFVTCALTFDLTCRFRMLDMRLKAPDRAMNLSKVLAQGDAVFLAFLRREDPHKTLQNPT